MDKLNEVLLKVINLEVDRTGYKSALRELKVILSDYEFDDEFINNINEDTIKGFMSAIDIIKRLIKETQKNYEDYDEEITR